jgi:hypothetical protein
MDLADFVVFLRQKSAVRSVTFATAADFFPEKMMAYVEKTWQQWLGPLVPKLPAFSAVVQDLRPQVDALIR